MEKRTAKLYNAPSALAKENRGWKNMALGARFPNLKGTYYQGGAQFSEGQGGAKFLRATMFFCKQNISVATLLLMSMYILISLI